VPNEIRNALMLSGALRRLFRSTLNFQDQKVLLLPYMWHAFQSVNKALMLSWVASVLAEVRDRQSALSYAGCFLAAP